MDLVVDDRVLQPNPVLSLVVVTDEEVIESPASVGWPQIGSDRPESILHFFWVKMSEGVGVSHAEQLSERFPLLWCVSWNFLFASRVIKIDLMVGNIQIPS